MVLLQPHFILALPILLEGVFLDKLFKGINVTIILPRFSVMVCCNDYKVSNYKKNVYLMH